MIHILKCLQYHHRNDLIKYCKDYGGNKEVSFFIQKQRATQEIATGSFNLGITKAEWINSISEIMAKFLFI